MSRKIWSGLFMALLAAALTATPTVQAQTTWYVDDDAPNDPCPGDPNCGDPNEDGSADHAFDAIQEGINAAVNGDTVLVLDGTYTGFGNREIDFEGRAIIVRSENGPESCVVDCEHSGRGFRFSSGEGPDSIMQGLTITNGYNDYDAKSYDYGGGILCTGSSRPTIANCTIRGNSASVGGGISSEGSSSPTITNCTISGNSADFGAGVLCGWDSSPTLINCTVSENSASGSGGGICCMGSNPTITDCTISENSAYAGGGVWSDSGNPTLTNCTISGNSATGYNARGGGVSCEVGSLTIANSTISWNSTTGDGGGVFCTGAISVTLTNCIIRGNSAGNAGGGVCCPYSNSALTNCTLSGNTASVGGGIYGRRAGLTIANCIFWGDTPQELYAFTSVSYCNVQGGWPGEGNIDANPQFAFGADLHLISGSPCIDAGTNTPVSGLPADDLDGNARPLDGDEDSVAIADMGAFEFNPTESSIALSPARFEFAGLEGGENPPDQNLYLRNAGGETLYWEITGQPDWLTVTPSSGESSGEVDQVTLSVDLSGQLHGVYTATLEIADPDAVNSPREAVVVLSVNKIFDVPSAVPTIQAAIDVSIPGDEVHAADGTYTGAGNKNLDFGGRAITVRSVSGDPALCTIDCEADGCGFYFHSGEGPESIVEGLTITNGNAVGGGGVCCVGSSPTLTDCTVSGNSADDGGGVYCYDSSSPMLTDCTISGNLAEEGGGVWCESFSSPTLNNCTISGNSVTGRGGGVYCYHSSNATLTNCTISGNSAEHRGGGVCCYDGSNATLTNCTISGNSTVEYNSQGGGVWSDDSDPVLINCTISGNSAMGWWGWGGGVGSASGNPTLTNCVIDENAAGGNGGGIWLGYCNPTLTNCTISGNSADDGGGIFLSGTRSSKLTNCIISGNTASDTGGGIRCYGTTCSPTVTNSTISGNSASIGGGLHSAGSPTFTNCILWANTPQEIYVFSDEPMVTYCDVQGGWTGEGNIDADPLFMDPDGPDDDPNTWQDNNYHLSAGSPCIDAADNTAVPPDVSDLDGDGDADERTPFDLDGNPRFVQDPFTDDTGVPDPPRYRYVVDMGAYEFQFCFGDLDDDGDVDSADLAQLLGSYGQTSGMTYYDGDLDGDGDVDLADLAELLGAYGTVCP